MRHKLTLVGTTTSLLLAATVVLAAPAEARRNVGGFASHCVPPGNAEITTHGEGPGLGATCICVTVTLADGSISVLEGPDGKCPPGNGPNRRR